MTLPLQYSKQKSLLKPSGIKRDYIRLQVKLRPEVNKIVISNNDYQMILQSLIEGHLVGLESESGIKMGQFQTSLSGAYIASEFISPSPDDMKVGFKSALPFLKDMRKVVSFEQIPTVVNSPQVSRFIFVGTTDNVQTEYINQIPLNTSGVLKIIGTRFIKQKMSVEVIQSVKASGKNVSQMLNASFDSGTKSINILISNIQLTDKDFKSGETSLPDYTRIIVTQIDNSERSTFFNFEFLTPPTSNP